mmetsp:Transcript_57864/g.154234  ORF Transcript_57864/g.154234 Transcript_57864/m.154234 type:complete len:87 (-) Transcript_57864:2723-2983(-)
MGKASRVLRTSVAPTHVSPLETDRYSKPKMSLRLTSTNFRANHANAEDDLSFGETELLKATLFACGAKSRLQVQVKFCSQVQEALR